MTCGAEFQPRCHTQKFCSNRCCFTYKPHKLTCHQCAATYMAYKSNSKYCSMQCKGLHDAPITAQANQKRRKYPLVDGLTKNQICYRMRGSIYNKRDTNARLEVLKFLGSKCVQCGYDKDVRGLVLDHKNGDGKSDRLRIGGKVYRYYASHLDEAKCNLQVLCATCNQIKAIENKEHNRSRRIVLTQELVDYAIKIGAPIVDELNLKQGEIDGFR